MSNGKYTGPYLPYEVIFEIFERSDIKTWASLEFISKTIRAFFLGSPDIGTRGYDFRKIISRLRSLFLIRKRNAMSDMFGIYIRSPNEPSSLWCSNPKYSWVGEMIGPFNLYIRIQIYEREEEGDSPNDYRFIFRMRGLDICIYGPRLQRSHKKTDLEIQEVRRFLNHVIDLPVKLIFENKKKIQ